MKKININDLLEKINKEEFSNWYLNHTNKSTEDRFNITSRERKLLSQTFNLKKKYHREGSCNISIEDKVKLLTTQVTKEQLQCMIDNHTLAYIRKLFKIGDKTLFTLLDYYEIDLTKERKQKLTKKTNLEKYGTEFVTQNKEVKEKSKQTCLSKYGTEFSFQSENNKKKSKQTSLLKYGTEFPVQSKEVQQKIKTSYIEHFGSIQNAYQYIDQKSKQTRIERSGSLSNSYKLGIEKQSQVIQEKYGVAYACMRPEARCFTNNSKPNIQFENLLIQNDIEFKREFPLEKYSYDFKVDNNLIEIDPSTTHNSTWGLFNNPKNKNYHFEKSRIARENNYRCIHIFDWDDEDKIIRLLKSNYEKIYARSCQIKEVNKEDCDKFLNVHHLQNTCNNQQIRLGLYYNDELVSIMTFGKPRYNKNYQYELLRYCSNSKMVGGSEKLFSHFVKTYNPDSIISYCDLSKFSGQLYGKLGFKLLDSKVSKHWYNLKTKQHVTDNLLNQRGFDQLFGTDFGKSFSNKELMLNNNFVEIYDAGQASYVYKG